jgi:hypothetical protein
MDKFWEVVQTLAEDPKSLLIVVGAVAFVGGLAGGVPQYFPIPAGPPQIAIVAFGAVLAAMGAYLVLGGKSGSSRPYGISITLPVDGSSEGTTFNVEGTARRLPAGKALWLVRIWDGDRYYPQKKVSLEKGQTTWKTSIEFGNAAKLGAFVFGEEGRELIEYEREAAGRHNGLFKAYESLYGLYSNQVEEKNRIPKDTTNQYMPAFKRSAVKALKITECHVITIKRI